jgi:glutamate dehydrogenase
VVRDGDLTEKQRNHLLAEMTDEVGSLVLRDNYEQNLALANAAANAPSLLHVHEDWMRTLEREGILNRELEGLPSSRAVRRRAERGVGLTTPELSVLLAWTKIVLAEKLITSDLPDDPYCHVDLMAYFPRQLREGFEAAIVGHPLRREIIVTQVVNDLVNGAGMTFWPRLAGETGATPEELTRANFVAREIFGSLPMRDEIKGFDNRLDAGCQTRMRVEMRTLVERASRWLVSNRRPPLDSQGTVDYFRTTVQQLMSELPSVLTGRELRAYEARRAGLVDQGVPDDLASRVAVLHPAYQLLGVAEIADRMSLEPLEVARLHFALGERLGLPDLVTRILALPRDDRWQTMARAALRDDVYAVHAQLTAQVLRDTDPTASVAQRIQAWEDGDAVVVTRAATTLGEICSDDNADLARMSVGLRVVRGLLAS